jgi:hypothetical protein
MSAAKHTSGPLTVRVSTQFPFNIETLNAGGEVVFVRELPAHSTSHRKPEDALNAVGMPPEWAEANGATLADEILRAAAPELLSIAERWAALDAGSWHQVRHANEKAELLADTRAVIAKATGGAL